VKVDRPQCGVDDGRGDYLNCPLTRDEYARFYDALVHAESATVHDFDHERFFEGCLPIEVMAHRGVDTLRFGPMKPVGLLDPRTGREPYAAVQLRQDNLAGDHYSLVGFQTQVKWGDQARVLRLIPGLENAEFVRFGMVHRNTYVNGPTVLSETWQVRRRPTLFFAGQMSGVEGYVESASSGLLAGLNAAALVNGQPATAPPRTTAIGALAYYVSHADPAHYEPSNITFGIMEPLARAPRGKMERKLAMSGPRSGGSGRWIRVAATVDRARGAVIDHLKSFLQFLRLNRNLSPHTVRAYDSDLTQFLEAVASRAGVRRRDLEPAALDRATIRGFLADAHAHGQSRATAARKLAAVRTFLRYLRREGVIDDDPATLIATPKRDVRMPAHLSEQEMIALLAAPADDQPLGRRDHAILELFYASGLRLSELAGLDIEDVNLSAKIVRVLGKGGKQRLVPFNTSTASAIRAYLRDRAMLTRGNALVEAGRRGGRLERDAAVRQLSRRAPHRPQHRPARAALCRGMQHAARHQPARLAAFLRHAPAAARRRPAAIQELLGHARLSTTQRYTHVNAAQLLEVYRKSHPRAGKAGKASG
jgi:site-specific recombinase XerD